MAMIERTGSDFKFISIARENCVSFIVVVILGLPSRATAIAIFS